MEASKFMHLQQSDAYWHQQPNTSAFKSPDLIELNSDSERNPKPKVEPSNYSSSQEEEVETEDDFGEGPGKALVKEGIGVYTVHSQDEESCHLLQTEDDSDNSDSENNLGRSSKSSLSNSSNSSADGATISDNEGTRGDSSNPGSKNKKHHSKSSCSSKDNYWDMTNEQEKYYTEQFTMLQPDVNGLISGSVAKGFFEKSKLPLVELREIWQLSDFTRDGCLNLSEFKMAMHLVVLRRHGLPIPSHFYIRPPLQEFHLVNNNNNNNTSNSSNIHHKQQLLQKANSICISNSIQPNHLVSSQNSSSITINNSKSRNNSTTSSAITTSNNISKLNPPSSSAVTAIVPPAPNPKIFSKSVIPVQTKVSTSTTKTRTTEDLHPKRASKEWTTFENEPLNFSSACDISGLVAPVPVRLKTPEDKLISSNINNSNNNNITSTPASASVAAATTIVREKREVASASSVNKVQQMGKFQLKAIQRPKLSGHATKVSSGTIAPPPPPRRKTHIRSSSLDLNRLTITDLRGVGKKLTNQNVMNSGGGGVVPEVPARSFLSPSHQGGAFSVYRKPSDSQYKSQPPELPQKKQTQSKVQLQQEVSDLKNENEILNRISSTLLDDLAGLEAKRKVLGYKIGQIFKKNGYISNNTNNSTNLSTNHPHKGSSNPSQSNHPAPQAAASLQKGQVS